MFRNRFGRKTKAIVLVAAIVASATIASLFLVRSASEAEQTNPNFSKLCTENGKAGNILCNSLIYYSSEVGDPLLPNDTISLQRASIPRDYKAQGLTTTPLTCGGSALTSGTGAGCLLAQHNGAKTYGNMAAYMPSHSHPSTERIITMLRIIILIKNIKSLQIHLTCNGERQYIQCRLTILDIEISLLLEQQQLVPL
jgi:hypothetical protein